MSLFYQLSFQMIYFTGFKQRVYLPYIFCQGKLRNSIFFENSLLGEVQQNPGTSCMFNFPVGVWLVSKTKSEKMTIPTGNLMMISIFYQIILIIGEFLLLDRFKFGDKLFDVYGVETIFVECTSDEGFILYDRHEFWVDIVMRNIELLCWEGLGAWIMDLGLPLRYLYWRLCGVGRK